MLGRLVKGYYKSSCEICVQNPRAHVIIGGPALFHLTSAKLLILGQYSLTMEASALFQTAACTGRPKQDASTKPDEDPT